MLTIGQVSVRAGLRASALRYYEQQGLLPRANRLGGKRVYDDSILERLNLIQLAKTAGFTLDEIRILLTTDGERPLRAWKRMAAVKQAELDREMFRLTVMKSVLARLNRCSCTTLRDCSRIFEVALTRHKARHG